MPKALSPSLVVPLFREGVAAFVAFGQRADIEQAWDRPACGVWSAGDLARHELDVIGRYHEWLDRAVASDATPPFAVAHMDAAWRKGVEDLADVDPPVALASFAERAATYVERLQEHWDLPYRYPRGTVTAGLHAGIACAEWHLHAWDLAGALGVDHRPTHPSALLRAAATCQAATRTGLGATGMRLMIPVVSHVRPWDTVLRRSGRTPRR